MLLTGEVDPKIDAAQSARPVFGGGRAKAAIAALVVLLMAPALRADDTAPRRVLTLAEAVQTARQRQPALRAAAANESLAEADVDFARGALLPQVVGTGLYQRTTANFVARPGALPSGSRATREPSFDLYSWWSFGATASQVIFDQAGIRNLARQKAEARATAADRQARALDVDAQVRAAFFAAQAARAIVGVAQAALDNNQRHHDQIEAFVQVGTRPEIDLAQARAELANARVALIQSQNGYELARLRLNQAMGLEGETTYDVDAALLAARSEEALSSAELLKRAYVARPDLRALEQRLGAGEQGLRAARGGYAPGLVASTTLSDQGTRLTDLTWNWNAGLSLVWPLFDGARSRAAVQGARAQLEGTAAQRDSLRQAIRVDVEEARLGVVGAKAVLEASGEALNNARQRLALAEGRYEAGVGSIIELSDAQLGMSQAEAQQVRAQFGLSSARAALMRAVGSVD